MDKNDWKAAADLQFQLSHEIVGGFDVGFDPGIPEETKEALMRFVYWVEDNYNMPITLWVDFKNRHYLIDRNKQRVGYKFYWADFTDYPVFENEADIPVIELPVKTGRYNLEEILASFIEAIAHYFAWLSNAHDDAFRPNPQLVESILQAYLAEHPL